MSRKEKYKRVREYTKLYSGIIGFEQKLDAH